MFVELKLTHPEAQVLVELLDAEAREMYPEIRRTETREIRAGLYKRLRAVERLAERLREATAAAPVGKPG